MMNAFLRDFGNEARLRPSVPPHQDRFLVRVGKPDRVAGSADRHSSTRAANDDKTPSDCARMSRPFRYSVRRFLRTVGRPASLQSGPRLSRRRSVHHVRPSSSLQPHRFIFIVRDDCIEGPQPSEIQRAGKFDWYRLSVGGASGRAHKYRMRAAICRRRDPCNRRAAMTLRRSGSISNTRTEAAFRTRAKPGTEPELIVCAEGHPRCRKVIRAARRISQPRGAADGARRRA